MKGRRTTGPPNEGNSMDRIYNSLAAAEQKHPYDEWDDGFNAGIKAAMRIVDKIRMGTT